MKKIVSVILMLVMIITLGACDKKENKKEKSNNIINKKVIMISCGTQILDGGSNEMSWKALQNFKDKAEIEYKETMNLDEFKVALDSIAKEKVSLIWVTDDKCAEYTQKAADANPNIVFAVLDSKFNNSTSNILGVNFKVNESAFLAGYLAAKTSKKNIIGFIGGEENPTVHSIENGYKQGAEYADKKTKMIFDYAGTFLNKDKGKSIAQAQFTQGADVIFQVAKQTGMGVIETAKEKNFFVIGADLDQTNIALKNVLSSIVKRTDIAITQITSDVLEDKLIKSKNYEYNLKSELVGISANNGNIEKTLYDDVMKVRNKIISGEIKVNQ